MTRQKATGTLSPEKQKITQLIFLWSRMLEEWHKDKNDIEKKKKCGVLFSDLDIKRKEYIFAR